MRNSDSESDSEFFESAEESLDEDEELKNVNAESKKSEGEVSTLACKDNNVDSVLQTGKDISGNSLSYRKRPDRVKRLLSNPSTKQISKTPSNELVFKVDKIVPDAFFQDITKNLSKNINKSFNTLHQKSSNVKDLILNSLPVSSANESRSFSYDDPISTLVDENDASKIESKQLVSQSEVQSYKLIPNVVKQEAEEEILNERNNEDREEEPITQTYSSSNSKKVQSNSSDVCNDNLEKGFGEDFNRSDVQGEKIILKALDKFCIDIGEQKENISDEIKNSSSSTELGPESIEIPHDQKGPNTEEISNLVLISNSETLQQQNEDLKINKISNNADGCVIHKKNEHYEFKEFLDPIVSGKINNKDGNLSSLENIENSGSFIKSETKDFNLLMEDKDKAESNGSVQELKRALESIVKEEAISSQSIAQEIKKEISEEGSNIQEKPVANSNDGWDDFDFSDNEGENSSKTDVSEEISEKVHKNCTPMVSDIKSIVTEQKNEAIKKNSDLTLSNVEDLKFKTKKDQSVPETTQQLKESESAQEDLWDWDNWDDSLEEKEEKPKNKRTQKPETKQSTPNEELGCRQRIGDSPDISTWKGWDSFAQKPQEKQGFSLGLGSWGVDMLLNKATAVTQGISNVLEAGLGAPDPETLARMEKLEKEKFREQDNEADEKHSSENSKKNTVANVPLFPVSGITSLVAGVTSKIVEHSKIQEIGSKVITGGLDTLETFGKKTMEVLQEGDPGLKNKRALLMGNNKVVLSQVLREAREKAERETKKVEEKEMAKKCHFETLFDDFQGLVHLEALEMLSRQCELKLEQISSGMNSEEQEDLNGILEEVEQLCTLDECDLEFKSSVLDFKTALQMAVEPLKNEISIQKIIEIHNNVDKWLKMSSESKPPLALINQKLVSTLAELTAAIVHQFHKSGELLSIKECRKTVEEVDVLSRLTNLLCKEINSLCEKCISLSASQPSKEGDSENLNFSVEVTVVMKNSMSYIRQAFDLLLPVIQLGAAV